MNRFIRPLAAFAALWVVVLSLSPTFVWAQSKPLSEEDLTSLLKLGIDEETIVTRVQKGGLSFAVDDATVDRLKTAGATDAVVKALQDAAKSKPKKPAPTPGASAITYQDMLKLLQLGLDESAIMARLQKSPTHFTLDAKQVEELKRAGASEKLLAAMAGQRKPSGDQTGDVTDFAILLDCSGSMMEKTTDGKTKMEVAKRVVADLVEKIP